MTLCEIAYNGEKFHKETGLWSTFTCGLFDIDEVNSHLLPEIWQLSIIC